MGEIKFSTSRTVGISGLPINVEKKPKRPKDTDSLSPHGYFAM
jgi:hypothetical protein